MYNKVDFPHPDLPTIDTNSPFCIAKVISLKILTVTGSLKLLLIRFASSIVCVILLSSYDNYGINFAGSAGRKQASKVSSDQRKCNGNKIIYSIVIDGISFNG